MTHLSLPMEAVPPSVSRRGVAHPRYPIATESALQSPVCLWQNSLGVFHCSLFVSLASFAGRISESKGPPLLRPEQNGLTSHPSYPRKAGYVCTQRYGPKYRCTALQVYNLFRTQLEEYHAGSTAMHKNRSPRKQGRGNHAIGNRPEFASAQSALPPSIHPALGVPSRHQRFHRCALQRIFSPSLGNGRSD